MHDGLVGHIISRGSCDPFPPVNAYLCAETTNTSEVLPFLLKKLKHSMHMSFGLPTTWNTRLFRFGRDIKEDFKCSNVFELSGEDSCDPT